MSRPATATANGLPSELPGTVVRPPSAWPLVLAGDVPEGRVTLSALPFAEAAKRGSGDWASLQVGSADAVVGTDNTHDTERLAHATVAVASALCRVSGCSSVLLAVAVGTEGAAALCPAELHCCAGMGFCSLVNQCCSDLRAVSCSGQVEALDGSIGASTPRTLAEGTPDGHVWVAVGEMHLLDSLGAAGFAHYMLCLDGSQPRLDLRFPLAQQSQALVVHAGLEVALGAMPGVSACAAYARSESVKWQEDANPDVSKLPLLSAGLRRVLLEDFNNTDHDVQYGPYLLHELFTARATQVPEGHVALVEGEHRDHFTTYSELFSLASQFESVVSSVGVMPGDLVALWMPRGRTVIVCALAVLQAGGAYLPCDESLPFQRVSYMLEVSGTRLLLADDRRLSEVPAGSLESWHASVEGLFRVLGKAGRLVWAPPDAGTCLPGCAALEAGPGRGALPDADHEGTTSPTQRLAYVIFTSGSTGKPKGVAVAQHSIVHLVEWVNTSWRVTEHDTLLFVTSIGFDLSCYDIFGSLAAGSCICIAPPGATAEWLFESVRSSGVTFWDSAPPVLQQLETMLAGHLKGGELLQTLRIVFMSGDWVPLSLVSLLHQVCPSANVVALGGATEVTVWSNFFPVEQLDPSWRSIPYGRPIWNHQYYALDLGGDPVQVGVAGHLHIGGIGVARGYIGRADLTTARFVANPFHGGRMYKTGDLVRFMPLSPWGAFARDLDGQNMVLEFLGRADFQVKIRGYRIELGEIERACEAVCGVEGVVVLAIGAGDAASETAAASKRLVAFVTPKTVDVGLAKGKLLETLPAYMVPETVVPLDAFPLSANGKVDRRALESMDLYAMSRNQNPLRAPGTELEVAVAEAFACVLGIATVGAIGADDDFFELGGQSLMALRLQSLLRETVASAADLTIQDIFRLRTPAKLAAELAGYSLAPGKVQPLSTPPPLEPIPQHREAVAQGHSYVADASFAQERLWLIEQFSPGKATYNVPFAYRLTGRGLSVTRLRNALRCLVARHEALRTAFQPQADGRLSQCVFALECDPMAAGERAAGEEDELLPGTGSQGAGSVKQLSPWLWLHDYRQLGVADADKATLSELHADVHRGFDLTQSVLRVRLVLLPPDSPSRCSDESDAGPMRQRRLPGASPAAVQRIPFSPTLSPLSPQRFPGAMDPPSESCSPSDGGPKRCLLYVNVHHIAFDGASLARFEQDLWSLYDGQSLPPLPLQYVDYSEWQRKWLMQDGELERGLMYWTDALADANFSLNLPTDHPYPPKLYLEGSAFTVWVPSSATNGIRKLARARKATEFVTLLAAYAVLLSHHCQQLDLLIGMPVASRQHDRRLEALVGFFVNTVAIRVDLLSLGEQAPHGEGAAFSVQGPANPPFSAVVDEVQKRVLSALRHAEVPWQLLVSKLRLAPRGLPQRGSPVVQTMFDFNDAGEFDFHHNFGHQGVAAVAAGVTSEPWTVRRSCTRLDPDCPGAGRLAAKFELLLDLSNNHHTGGYTALWEYCTELFQEATVRNLAKRFSTLLELVGRDPHALVKDIPMISHKERKLTLHDWGVAASMPMPELCVHDLIISQASRTPWSRALSMSGTHCSFSTCLLRARAAAHRLQQAGLQAGFLVGLLMWRDMNTVCVMLGVLMTGCAYVPMAPDMPQERLLFMVQDGGLAAVITSAALQDTAQACGALVLVMDCESALGNGVVRDPPMAFETVPLSATMYVLYTSGTTGRPKGVVVSHQAVMTHVCACIQKFSLTAFDQVLQSIALGFDFAVSQLYPYLAVGGSVLLPSEELCKDPQALAREVAAGGVTSVDFVPTMFSFFMESEELVRQLASVRRVNLGGEMVGQELCRHILSRLGAKLFVTYGPTEAAVDTTTWAVPCTLEPSSVAACPIGWPDPWRAVHVTCPAGPGDPGDPCNSNVPAGTPGELCIAGPGLSCGYLGHLEQSARAFVPSAFAAGNSYRSGDLVRWRGLQGLDFLGRLDSQVKLRGQRIELGEIAAVLQRLPGVVEAQVVLAEGSGGSQALVAFASPAAVAGEGAGSLLEQLAKQLPVYMVPRHVMSIDEWPRSRTGKLDHSELRKLADAWLVQDGLAEENLTEESPVELLQCAACCTDELLPVGHSQATTSAAAANFLEMVASVLGRQTAKLDLSQTFARLGGDSIAAIRATARLREKGFSISPSQLLSKSSLRETMALVGEVSADIPAEQGPVSGVVPLGPMQARFFSLPLREAHHYNQSQLLVVRAPLNLHQLSHALRILVSHHDMLRAKYIDQADGTVCQVVMPPDAASESFAVTECTVEMAELGQVISSVQGSLNLASGPLLAAALLHVSGVEDRLLLVAHHLVVDIVSWEILLEDLETCLFHGGGCTAGALPPRSCSFREWVALQACGHRRGESLGLSSQARGLTSAGGASDSSHCVPEEVNTWGRARRMHFAVDPATSACLLGAANEAYSTKVVELLLAALAEAHAKSAAVMDPQGAGALTIDLEGHGRDPSLPGLGVARTVGWFTALCQLELRAEASLGETVRAVKESYRRLPLDGRPSSYSGPATARPVSPRPSPAVCFNYHGLTCGRLSSSGGATLLEQAPEWHSASIHDVHPANAREYLLEVEGAATSDRRDAAHGEPLPVLGFEWIYSPDKLDVRRLESWSEIFVRELGRIAAHCMEVVQSPGRVKRCTPSDYPLAGGMSISELDAILGCLQGMAGMAGPEVVEDVYPCTPLQEALLMETLVDPSANVEQLTLHLRGPLDPQRWHAAWSAMVRRHGILRTRLLPHAASGQPPQSSHSFWQVVLHRDSPDVLPEWVQADWDTKHYETKLLEQLRQDRTRGFACGEQMVRFALFRLQGEPGSVEEHLFVWSEHHALTDGWSGPLLLREALDAYDDASKISDCSDEPPTFRSYVECVMQRDLSGLQSFWRTQLQGWQDVSGQHLALSPQGGEMQATAECSRFHQLTRRPCVRIKDLTDLGRQCSTTLAAVINAVWALVLAFVTVRADVAFGVVLSGRDVPVPRVERMVGLLICTLALRLRFDEDTALEGFLQSVQQALLSLAAHQHCNITEIREWCGLRGSSGNLMQTLLVVENYPELVPQRESALQVQPLALERLPVTGAQLPLAVIAVPEGEHLKLTAHFDSSLHADESVGLLLEHFEALLEAMPQVPLHMPCRALVRSVPILSEIREYPDMLARHAQWSALLDQPVERVFLGSLPLVVPQQAIAPPHQPNCLNLGVPLLPQGADTLAVVAAALAVSLCRLSKCSSVMVLVAVPLASASAGVLPLLLECSPDTSLSGLAEQCAGELRAAGASAGEGGAVLSAAWMRPLASLAPEGQLRAVVGGRQELRCLEERLPAHLALALDAGGSELELSCRAGAGLGGVCGTSMQVLLDAVACALTAGDTEITVAGVPMLSPDMRRLLLDDFNDTAHSFEGKSLLLHEPFEERSHLVPPGHVALMEGDPSELEARTTYEELRDIVTELSKTIISLGVGQEELVALWLPRTRMVVACALAVLKVGGAYLPCDDGLPFERVAYMLEVSESRLLVVDNACKNLVPADFSLCKVLDIELVLQVGVGGKLELAAEAGSSPQVVAADGVLGNQQLAYAIFTSGSTGRPKGVAVSHESIVHLIEWVNTTFHVSHRDILLFTTSIGFDLSCYDMFGSLAAGSTVRIAPRGATPETLFELVRAGRVTFWDSAPPVLQQLDSMMTRHLAGGQTLADVRVIFMSGDWVPLPLVSTLYKACPSAQVVALGGATEVTVWSNFFHVEHIDSCWTSVPYGRPIWNHQYYSLEPDGQPLHVGMAGELHIGGIGVARGYVGRPDLTAERFLVNPFHGGRMYRTGDLVRFMPLSPWGNFEGPSPDFTRQEVVLEFLGRMDCQVKIRGYRVELGEVERALEGLGQVDVAVVLVVGAGGVAAGAVERRLVAFVTPTGADVADLRASLRRTLPAYMVPDTIVALPVMPLTKSGKLDRAALQAMDLETITRAQRSFRPPETPLQEAVTHAFKETLGLSGDVGLDDDFFELGGHSLLALRLQASLRSCGIPKAEAVTLQDMFSLRTPALLAEALEARAPDRLEAGPDILYSATTWQPPPLLPRRPAPPVAGAVEGQCEADASFAQERLWLVDRLHPAQTAYNIPFAYKLRGPRVSVLLLAKALHQLVGRHEVLRTVLRARADGSLAQCVLPLELDRSRELCDGDAAPHTRQLCSWAWVHKLDHLPEAEAQAAAADLMRREASTSFQLDRGVLRAHIISMRTGEPEAVALVLLMNVHHVAFDGVSVGVLERDLWALYSNMDLPSLPLQYADYASWQRQWLIDQGALRRGLEYWMCTLQDTDMFLHLPTDRPYPAQLGCKGSNFSTTWPSAWSAGIQELARINGTTEMCTLLTLYGVVLSRHCQQEDVLVGIPEAGRSQDPMLDQLIGFFVNTVPVRLQLQAGWCGEIDRPSFSSLLRETHQRVMEALEHAFVPWQLLVAELRKARPGLLGVAGRAPVLQAFFQHFSHSEFAHGATPTPEGVECTPCLAEVLEHSDAVKFELSLQSTSGKPGEGFLLAWSYNLELFADATVRLLDRHFATLACAALKQPEAPWHLLPMVPQTERAAVLHDWTASSSSVLSPCCVHELFLQQAQRTPHQTAVQLHQGRGHLTHLTYRMLASASSRVSRELTEVLNNGSGTADPWKYSSSLVGVLADRSLEMIVAVFAASLAGAAFLPLSPDLPLERLLFMVEDARVGAIVTTSSRLELARCLGVQRVVDASSSLTVASKGTGCEGSAAPLGPRCSPCDPVYVIYTSGSTGRPKGVLLDHSALLSHLEPYTRMLGLQPWDRVLLTSPFNFDMAYSQLFCPLLIGASLIVTAENPMVDPMEMVAILSSESITFAAVVPSVLMTIKQPHNLPAALRHLGSGGEALPASLARQLLEGTAPVLSGLLHNRYGPTECAVNAMTFGPIGAPALTGDDDLRQLGNALSHPTVPIGWPSAHRHVFVCRGGEVEEVAGASRLTSSVSLEEPSTAHRSGELLLAGPGLALKYINRPEITAEQFVESSRSAGKVYRTGDQVRQVGTNGCILYMGRADFQVKLQGQRIELGEIEAVLREQPGVMSVVVVLQRQVGVGFGRLVAFVSPPLPDCGLAALAECRRQLPPHMVPHHIVGIDRWPRTATGKIDRRALQDVGPCPSEGVPEQDQKSNGSQQAGTRSSSAGSSAQEATEILRHILAEVLGQEVSAVQAAQPLTTLGLTSLLAVHVFTMASERGLPGISVRQLLRAEGTLADVAAMAAGREGKLGDSHGLWSELLELLAGTGQQGVVARRLCRAQTCHAETSPIFICPGDGGVGCEGYRPLALQLEASTAVWVFDGLLGEPLQGKPPLSSMGASVARCIEAARAVCPGRPYQLLGHSWGAAVALEAARQLEEAGEPVGGVFLLDPSPELFGASDACSLAPQCSQAEALAGLLHFASRCGVADLGEELHAALAAGAHEQATVAARIAFGAEMLAHMQAVADAREHNLRLRPPHWPSFPKRIKAKVLLVLAIDQSVDDWDRIDKRTALIDALAGLAEDVSTVWVAGDHYSMLLNPQCVGLARTLAKALGVSSHRLLVHKSDDRGWLQCMRRSKERQSEV